ncbi:hypothetical protein L6452_04700 [Arctium lappa]|uniref:Uncharacterized protein n=1 Tax=Arctium lappa TaxID=4217 RepID=A0ACB9EFD7_ARCLA|nr:hypothetical protein L6452_04700 [Arctium lappa]
MAISMEFLSQFPWSNNPTPPPTFNLFLSITNPRFLFLNKVNKSQPLCHCSSISSSHQQQLQEPMAQEDDDDEGEGQFGNLVEGYGWQVRKMVEKDDEMRSVANIQAQAFHQPLFLFNDVFFQFFQAEVLAGLLYRLRNSPPDRYACLVAETSTIDDQKKQLVGVVDVTVFRDESVLKHLSEANEYLYVSGIAVLHDFRRKKVASVLLKACETLALLWGYKYLVLRAYEDDLGARKLYTNAGYTIVSGDPVWTTSWIGRRRRILMLKQCDMT